MEEETDTGEKRDLPRATKSFPETNNIEHVRSATYAVQQPLEDEAEELAALQAKHAIIEAGFKKEEEEMRAKLNARKKQLYEEMCLLELIQAQQEGKSPVMKLIHRARAAAHMQTVNEVSAAMDQAKTANGTSDNGKGD